MGETERFKAIPIFHGLEQKEIGRLLKITEERTYEAGTFVFKPGDPVEGFYIILEGKIEIRSPKKDDPGGALVTLATLANRSVFGEMALIADRKRASAAVAIEKTRVMMVSKKDFDGLIEAGDLSAYKVVHAFAKLLGERLRRTEDELIALIREMGAEKQEKKLAELQAFRQKLFQEWSF
jgi:CRP/FNR family transcriptional regulator, cyclic AMP receptor protein